MLEDAVTLLLDRLIGREGGSDGPSPHNIWPWAKAYEAQDRQPDSDPENQTPKT